MSATAGTACFGAGLESLQANSEWLSHMTWASYGGLACGTVLLALSSGVANQIIEVSS